MQEALMAIRTTLPLLSPCLLAACGSNAGGGSSDEGWSSLTQAETVSQSDRGDDHGGSGRLDVRHVVLISVDGLHEADAANWIAAHPTSTLAQLADKGVE
jgi:hypothetical protein